MPTEAQLRDIALRQRIRALIEKGHQPLMVPSRIDAGYGAGHICLACGQPIFPIYERNATSLTSPSASWPSPG